MCLRSRSKFPNNWLLSGSSDDSFFFFFLVEFQMLGVDCFYNNSQLVSWADVVFLCCLPAHLLHICSEIQNAIREHCIIYSLVSTVPLPRYVCTLHIKLDLEAKWSPFSKIAQSWPILKQGYQLSCLPLNAGMGLPVAHLGARWMHSPYPGNASAAPVGLLGTPSWNTSFPPSPSAGMSWPTWSVSVSRGWCTW